MMVAGAVISIAFSYALGLGNSIYEIGVVVGGWITGIGAAISVFANLAQERKEAQ